MKHIAKLFLLVPALCASLAGAAAPGGIRMEASLDSAVLTMGSRAALMLDIDIPLNDLSAVSLADLPLLTPGQEYLPWNGIDIVSSDTTVTTAGDRRHIQYRYVVQAFDPGTVTLPPFALTRGAADTVRSNVVTLKVLPVELDSLQELNPMASVAAPATRWYDYLPEWLLWTLLAIAVAVAAVAAYFILRKRRAVAEERRNPPIPPYELAISRLNALRSRGLAENGNEKQYYTELTDILRQYLHGRFGINAMEMTSSQIVRALRSNPDTRMTADQMRSVLSIADFVKFAKVRPLPDDNNRTYARAVGFVEETRPQPELGPDGVDAPAKANNK